MRTETGTTIRREDYRPFAFRISSVKLEFELDAELTWVRSQLTVQRRQDLPRTSNLVLDGEDLALISVHVNGHLLTGSQYQLSESMLTLMDIPDDAEIVNSGLILLKS
jgi:aminopeptidase N